MKEFIRRCHYEHVWPFQIYILKQWLHCKSIFTRLGRKGQWCTM